MQSFRDYFVSSTEAVTLQTEEQIHEEARQAGVVFEAAKQEFFDTLATLVDANPNLAIFIKQKQSELDGREIPGLLEMLPTASAKDTYNKFITTKRIQNEIELKRTAYQTEANDTLEYNKNLNDLYAALEHVHDSELAELKRVVSRLLKYMEENNYLKLMPKSKLNEIILSLKDLLEPENLDDDNRRSLNPQKLNFKLKYGLTYDYRIRSSVRYCNFAQHVDSVKGARDVNGLAVGFMSLCLYAAVAFLMRAGIFFLLIWTSGGVAASAPLALPSLILGVTLLVLALITHLITYTRTGLSKQFATVADVAFDLEEKRLNRVDVAGNARKYEADLEALKGREVNNDILKMRMESALDYINSNYYQADNPKRGLSLLKILDEMMNASSRPEFNERKESLVLALQLSEPRRSDFFSSQAKDKAVEIPAPISELIQCLNARLLEKENIETAQAVVECKQFLNPVH